MADQTAVEVQTVTLVAATNVSIEITGPGSRFELLHHGNTTDVVYYAVSPTDPAVALTGAGADNEYPLGAGERLVVNGSRTGDTAKYIQLISAGAPTVSVINLPGGY